jgi:hypothetical protein
MAMGSTFEDRSDLFAPPYIPGDPESARANREWNARNHSMTYDLVDELRMPREGDKRTLAEMNANPFAVSNANDGDPRGDVDPLALVALAQGGPYDIAARRAAIQARRDAIAKLLTDQQVAQQLAQAAPTDTASRELTSGLRPDYKDTGQGIQAGDMAVSGATPGFVTQQGFFETAVPNPPDPNNVWSSPPPPNSPPPAFTRDDESEPDKSGKGKASDFDEDAANQAVADALAEAIANAPAAPTGHDPGENDQDAIDQGHNDVVAAALADAIANAPADAPGAPSSHNSGRNADVVSPSTTNAPAGFNSGYSDFISGPGGFAGFNAGSMMPGFGIPGDAGIPGSGNILGGPTAPAAPAAPSAPDFSGKALSDLDIVAPGAFDYDPGYDPGSHSLADIAMGKGGPDKGGFTQGIVDPNAPSEGGIPGYSPGNFAAPSNAPAAPGPTGGRGYTGGIDQVSAADKAQADREAQDAADIGRSLDISLEGIAQAATAMGAPATGKNALADFTEADAAQASINAPGPVSPGSFSGWGTGIVPGGFQAPGPAAPTGWGSTTPGFTPGGFQANASMTTGDFDADGMNDAVAASLADAIAASSPGTPGGSVDMTASNDAMNAAVADALGNVIGGYDADQAAAAADAAADAGDVDGSGESSGDGDAGSDGDGGGDY